MSNELQLTCSRCGAIVPPAVHPDTGGVCRQCQKTIPKRVEVADLVACMSGNDKRYRGVYFDNYCKRKPSLEAIPILRRALIQDDHYLVKCAAVSLGKMKENAKQAVSDLLMAAVMSKELAVVTPVLALLLNGGRMTAGRAAAFALVA